MYRSAVQKVKRAVQQARKQIRIIQVPTIRTLTKFPMMTICRFDKN